MANEELISKIKDFANEQKELLNGFELQSDFRRGETAAYSAIISFLSTLESEKPVPNDLAEEVKRYYSDNFDYISSDQPTLSILTNIARHFTDWQKEQDEKEQADLFTIVALDAAQRAQERQYQKDRAEFAKLKAKEWSDGYDEGIIKGKEQMMKEAVEWTVTTNLANRPVIYLDQLKGFQYGDKVRVIIVKED